MVSTEGIRPMRWMSREKTKADLKIFYAQFLPWNFQFVDELLWKIFRNQRSESCLEYFMLENEMFTDQIKEILFKGSSF